MKNDSIFDRMNAHTNSLSALVAGEKTNNQTGKAKATQSKKQLAHRMQFCNVMANSQLMAYNIRGGYQYKPKSLSYHNMFAKYNLGKVKIYLDKNEVLNKACVVAPYNITIGSLPSIDVNVQADSLVTSIRVPQGFLITETSTIGEVSAALLSASSDMMRGDQISIVHLVQAITGGGIPRASLRLHEFILDKSSTTLFYTQISPSLFYVKDGYIGTDANAEEGGIAYVLSRKQGSKILVSTQSIVLTPGNATYKKYSSEEKMNEALDSYGTDNAYFYDPEAADTRQDEKDTYFSVTKVTKNGTLVPQEGGELNVVSGDVIEITGTKLTEVEIKARILTDPTGTPSTVGLSAIGTVQGITERSVKITVNKSLDIFYLLRADNSVVIYNFG